MPRGHWKIPATTVLGLSVLGSLLGVVALGGLGCKKKDGDKAAAPPAKVAPRPVATKAAAQARAGLLTTIVIPSLDKALANVDGLVKTLQVPLPIGGPAKMRKSLLEGMEIPAAVVPHLRTDRPLAMVVVSPGPKKDEVAVAAVEVASAAAGEQAIKAAGAPAETKEGAVSFKRANGKALWLMSRGTNLLVSESFEAFAIGTELAIEARGAAPAGDDIVVTFFPDAMAKAKGTDVKTALGQMRAELTRASTAGQGAPTGKGAPLVNPAAAMELSLAVWDTMIDKLGDVASVEIGARVDADKGVTIALRARPRGGSPLAESLKVPGAYAVPPGLISGSDFGVWVGGPGTMMPDMTRGFGRALGKQEGGADAGKSFEALAAVLTQGVAASARADKKGLAYDVVYLLAPGSKGDEVLAQIHGIARSKAVTDLMAAAYGPLAPKVTWKREGKLLRMTAKVSTKALPKDAAAAAGSALDTMFGGSTIEMWMASANDRLAMALGPGGKARVDALVAGKGGGQPGESLTTALAETKGHDGIAYLDIAALARMAVAIGQAADKKAPPIPPMIQQVLANEFPVFMSYRGGDALFVDARIPPTTLRGLATVVGGFVAMMGAAMRGGMGPGGPGGMPPGMGGPGMGGPGMGGPGMGGPGMGAGGGLRMPAGGMGGPRPGLKPGGFKLRKPGVLQPSGKSRTPKPVRAPGGPVPPRRR